MSCGPSVAEPDSPPISHEKSNTKFQRRKIYLCVGKHFYSRSPGLFSLAKEGGFCIPPAGREEEEEGPREANVPPPPP